MDNVIRRLNVFAIIPSSPSVTACEDSSMVVTLCGSIKSNVSFQLETANQYENTIFKKIK